MAIHSVRRLALGDLEHELVGVRSVLERIPFDRDDWAPHPKSFTVRALGLHCATLPWWGAEIVRRDAFDVSAPAPPRPPVPSTSPELLTIFDRNRSDLLAALDGASDQHLTETWTMRNGAAILSAMPRWTALRSWLVNHAIHHRGQLTVYLRLLDRPVPSLFGPTADDR